MSPFEEKGGEKMKMKTLTVLLLMCCMLMSLGSAAVVFAKEPSERFKGYNSQQGKWVVGNLGKDYAEGDFVSYELRIDSDSKIWGADVFSISYNFFQPSSGAIYIDGFDTSVATGFQWSNGDFLPNGVDIPPAGWGTHIVTPEAGEAPVAGQPSIINFMDAWPPGTGDGTGGSSPAVERYFSVQGMQWTGDHIILFFRAHLALDYIWSAGLESTLPTSLAGDEFAGWTAAWHGASFATGSSRHFYLQYPGIGDKTIPIPIVQHPPMTTVISGKKYVCAQPSGWTTASGWTVTLTLPDGSSVTDTTDVNGDYEFLNVPIIAGTYTIQESFPTPPPGWECSQILTTGPFDSLVIDLSQGLVSFELTQEGPYGIDFYNSITWW